jgi:hypothetical protein
MSLLSRLFGKAPAKAPEPVLHKDFRIFPAPIKEAGGYRIAARVEKDFPDGVKVHHLQRADTIPALEEATSMTLAKARQAIDQLGDALFG